MDPIEGNVDVRFWAKIFFNPLKRRVSQGKVVISAASDYHLAAASGVGDRALDLKGIVESVTKPVIETRQLLQNIRQMPPIGLGSFHRVHLSRRTRVERGETKGAVRLLARDAYPRASIISRPPQ